MSKRARASSVLFVCAACVLPCVAAGQTPKVPRTGELADISGLVEIDRAATGNWTQVLGGQGQGLETGDFLLRTHAARLGETDFF